MLDSSAFSFDFVIVYCANDRISFLGNVYAVSSGSSVVSRSDVGGRCHVVGQMYSLDVTEASVVAIAYLYSVSSDGARSSAQR
jgi:hypothetical protein